MKLAYLKTQLETVAGSLVEKVYFDQAQIVNVEINKDYPYVLWDLNTYKSTIAWADTAQEKEQITMKAYVFGYLDKNLAPVTGANLKEAKWDELRAAFRSYMTVINATSYIQVTNMSSMANELFEWGRSVDSEIAVSFDVKLDLFCNV